jgi:uncharacterized pyridoxamine 5'-phosphate oxidase family protein
MKHFYVYYSYEEYGRGYIGKRECKCLPQEDVSYFGSFKDKTFNPTQKIILETFNSVEEALEAECALHDFYEVDKNPHFANRAKQTSTGFRKSFNTNNKDFCDKFKQIVQSSTSYSQVIRKLNLVINGSSLNRVKKYVKILNLRTDHFTASKWNDGIIEQKDLNIWHCKNKYKIINLNGEIFITKNLKKFCIKNNLTVGNMWMVINNRRNHHKGWKGSKI